MTPEQVLTLKPSQTIYKIAFDKKYNRTVESATVLSISEKWVTLNIDGRYTYDISILNDYYLSEYEARLTIFEIEYGV